MNLKYTRLFTKGRLAKNLKQMPSWREFYAAGDALELTRSKNIRHIPAKTSLTQWRFFKKCRIEDIFCFASVFTQFFLKWLVYLGLTSKVTKAARNTFVPELLCNNVLFHGEPTVKPKLLPSEGEQAQSPELLWRREGKHGHQRLFRLRRCKLVI